MRLAAMIDMLTLPKKPNSDEPKPPNSDYVDAYTRASERSLSTPLRPGDDLWVRLTLTICPGGPQGQPVRPTPRG